MRLQLALSVAGVLLSLCGGCSLLFVGSDYTGGSKVSDGGDTPDAFLAAADAQPRSDAADDAGPDAGPAPPFCATRTTAPSFCLDFDSSPSYGDHADSHAVSGWTTGGVSELDHQTFVSPSTSVHLSVPGGFPGTGSGLTNALVYNVSPPPQSSAHVECKLRVDADDATAAVHALTLYFGTSSALILYSSRTEAGIQMDHPVDGSMVFAHEPFASPLPLGKWLHVEMDVVVSSGTAKLTVAIDGTPVLSAFTLDASYAAGGGGEIAFGPGYYTNSTVAGASFHFDDLLADFH